MNGVGWLLFGSGVLTGAVLVFALGCWLLGWIASGEPDANGDVERDSKGN